MIRTEVHRDEGKNEAKRNDRALYETADKECKNFIMDVFDETWYKELEDSDTFYTNVTALKLLEHLTEFCSGLHTVDTVDIPQVMKTLFSNADGIPQYINTMEATHRKSKRAKIVLTDEYMHAVTLKSLLQSGEYETEMREWSKLQETQQTWTKWKTTFWETYVAKRCSEAAQEGEEKPFSGSVTFGVTNKTQTKGAQLTHHMMDFLEGYLNNIAAAATQTADPSGPLAGLAAILAVSVETIARQQQEIKRLTAQLQAFTKRGPQETKDKEREKLICKHCEAIRRTTPHGNKCFFDPKKITDRKEWAHKLMEKNGVPCKDD